MLTPPSQPVYAALGRYCCAFWEISGIAMAVDRCHATSRNRSSGWPLLPEPAPPSRHPSLPGWDFAPLCRAGDSFRKLRESSRSNGRPLARCRPSRSAFGSVWPSFSEVMAHEWPQLKPATGRLPPVGRDAGARRQHWWNYWENDAAQGQMGGIAQVVLPIEQWPPAAKPDWPGLAHSSVNSWSRKSVKNMWPGLCVIRNGGLHSRATA